jgi:alcohol dehydrogenase
MTPTMRALVFGETGQPILEERPLPQLLAATDAVIKMVKSTICGKILLDATVFPI